MTSTTLSLRKAFIQSQVVQLFGRARTIEQVNDVFKLASELITLTDEIDPMSATLYELVLKRRTELLKRPQHWPSTDSWFPLRVPSLQCRANAASAKHIPTQLARSQSSGASNACYGTSRVTTQTAREPQFTSQSPTFGSPVTTGIQARKSATMR